MAKIPKTKVYNPQKAEAYVGKGVLKNGGGITPVPNGPLIKKDGTSLKNGGKMIVKALRLGVHVALVIGVQYPLCLGLTASCIQFFLAVAMIITF